MGIIKKIIILSMLSLSLLGAEIKWSEDYETALVEAKEQHKDLYIFISSTSCPWCAKFEREVLTDAKVIKALEKDYIVVHLMKEMDDIPEGYSARVIPRHYFADNKGKSFYTFAGYYDATDFLDTLDEIKEERSDLIKQ